ncbi:MAG: ATP-binding protein [Acidobacteria bacterium]|nr:ATP-binding protein [Acidobacteriota bacterium]
MPEPLLNREDELQRLERAWGNARRGPQLVVVWGRRRVGKTFLVAHFARTRHAVFFGATQQAEVVELGRLAEAVRRDLGDRVADLTGGSFTGWESALRFLAALAAEDPLVVVLDEVPYLLESTPGFASIVQGVWDHLPRGTHLLLILTGSAIGTIERMLGPNGPLRGRPTDSIRLDPLDLWNARLFLPRLDPPRLIEAYAACGGYPLHLAAWDPTRPTEKNLERLAGRAGSVLLEDAPAIMGEELPDAVGYPRILAAIGRGRTRYAEIAGDAGQRVEHALDVLARAGLVEKIVPVGAPKAARPIYAIADVYLAFWFRVLYSDLSLIEAGQGAAVLRRARPRWQNHLGRLFEDVARAHARRLVARGDLPEDLVVGRWWATTGESSEVDVLGLQQHRAVLVGEARWQAAPLGVRELERLRRKAVRVPDLADEPIYALWGRAGVADDVRSAGGRGFDLPSILDVSA